MTHTPNKEEIQSRVDKINKLKKQLSDQQVQLSADIKVREADLVTIRNTYERCCGALEILGIQLNELDNELNALEDG
jgi:chromosome segregation ATPase